MRSVIRMRGIAFAVLLISLLVIASQSAQAATLTVSTTADAGPGSLRQAIIDATSNAAANTIIINIPLTDPGYNSTTDRFTINLVNQLPDIPLAPLTIDNMMGRGVTLKGNGSFRILTLVNSAVLSISNLKISQGSTNGGKGGGIYMGDSAVVFLTNCIVSNNTATNGGGGIWVNDSGVLHIINTTINDNTTTNGDGGGIYINNSGTLNITGSTVNGNAAPSGGGGGIYNGVSGTVNATNVTLNGNTAGTLGGGIHNNATATVNSSTISGNMAASGGGIYNNFTTTLNNSLIALNMGADGPDLLGRGSRGKPFSGNNNLIGNADGSEAFGPTTNQLGSTGSPINPRLGPLQDNGGPTFTQALLAGSPAIDAGATALASDQRGVSRPQDGDGVGGAQPDIGSFESEGLPELTINDVTVAEPANGSTLVNFTVSLSRSSSVAVSVDFATTDGTALAGSDYTANAGTLVFAPGETSKTVTVTVLGDALTENAENFIINLTNAQGGARIPDSQGTGTITDTASTPTPATVTLSNLSQTYEGTAKFATATTNPPGLNVNITYTQNGTPVASPTNVGSYDVTATITDPSYQGSATGVMVINKADQTITFGALSGKAYSDPDFTVSATASSNLSVSFAASGQCTVNGNAVHITSAGSCIITASQAGDGNYNAATSVAQSFTVSNASATITLSNLMQTYDGTAKSPTAVTNPSGLNVTFTYSQNGSPISAPTTTGTYNVTATINDSNYQGSTTSVLVINQATPAIMWNNPANIVYGTPLSSTQLNATASTPGTFQYNPPAGTVLNAGTHQLSVTFTPNDTANYTTATANVQITIDPVTGSAFNIENASYSVSEGAYFKQFNVIRTGDTSAPGSVDYASSDMSAIQRTDYTLLIGTLNFAAGETSKTVTLLLTEDSFVEGDEALTVTLSNPVGATLGAQSIAQFTITDNDTDPAVPNAIDDVPNFVRQHYHDFMNREPDSGGFQGWQNTLNNCPSSGKDANGNFCDRIEVSAGFFRSEEFQTRGYFIYRFYSAVGSVPHYESFMPDYAKVNGFLSAEQLEANKSAFVSEFMTRSDYQNLYGSITDNDAYVTAVLNTLGLPNHSRKAEWVTALNGGAPRAQVLRSVIEDGEAHQKFYTEAFVIMQYFGYLRRSADISYLNWIQTMNQTGGDYRIMINGFLNSIEYRGRFGQ